jgi:hypothetical protein
MVGASERAFHLVSTLETCLADARSRAERPSSFIHPPIVRVPPKRPPSSRFDPHDVAGAGVHRLAPSSPLEPWQPEAGKFGHQVSFNMGSRGG